MYVRSKRIKDHTYYYLVEGTRYGKKVQQKVIRYLGKQGWSSLTPTRFTAIMPKDHTAVFTRVFKRLGCRHILFTIPPLENAGLSFGYTMSNHLTGEVLEVNFRRPVNGLTLAHELGHVLDRLLQNEQMGTGSASESFQSFHNELTRAADYTFSKRMTINSKARLEKLRQLQQQHPKSRAIIKEIDEITGQYAAYAYTPKELFARLVSVCLIDPRKARQLAPRATEWLMRELWTHPRIREVLTSADAWELGTTEEIEPIDETSKTQ